MVKEKRTIAIIQARMGSSRLPGKVLMDLGGQPMLARVMERVRRAILLDDAVVATTQDASDDPLEKFCQERGYPCLRGSQFDVLDRYFQAARTLEADTIVRITADCPLIDPGLIDAAIRTFREAQVDFLANRLPPPLKRTYPIGLDIEMCTMAALERAWKEAKQTYQREHVMPYLYENVTWQDIKPSQSIGLSGNGFRVLQLNHVPDYGNLRWTVDTLEDLTLIQQVFNRFSGNEDFSWLDILTIFKQDPQLSSINSLVQQKDYKN